jgi:uncharacterized protein with HEPN domain
MKDPQVYLLHIRDATERVLRYTAEGKSAFLADPKTQDAVVRNLEIIGEAVKNLPDLLKAGHPDIPWKQMAGMRDKVIHEYFGVNLQLVWEVVERELPALRQKIEMIITREPGGSPTQSQG